MKDNKRKKKSFLHLILIMFIGAVTGVLMSRLTRNLDLEVLIGNIENLIYSNITLIIIFFGFFSILISAVLFFQGKKKVDKSLELDEEIIDDKLLTFGTIIADMGSTLILIIFIISLGNVTFSNYKGVLINGGAAIIFMLILAFISNQIVEFIKTYNPEKHGDIYTMSFHKDWVESSDEREEKEIYKAGYSGYTAMQYGLLIGIVFLGVVSLEIKIGIIPFLMLGIIFLVGKIFYYLSTLKNN